MDELVYLAHFAPLVRLSWHHPVYLQDEAAAGHLGAAGDLREAAAGHLGAAGDLQEAAAGHLCAA